MRVWAISIAGLFLAACETRQNTDSGVRAFMQTVAHDISQGRGRRRGTGIPLDERERDGPEFVVPRGRADKTHRGTVQLDRVTVGGQPVRAAVEVQHDQAARRMTEVMHPRHRLLPR